MIIRPGSIAGTELPDYFRSRTRSYPIQFRHGLSNWFYLDIVLPEGWSGGAVERSDSIVTMFGKAKWIWRNAARQVRVESTDVLQGESIPPANYVAFREYLDAVRVGDLREIVIIK
jgi:hypothetical protein